MFEWHLLTLKLIETFCSDCIYVLNTLMCQITVPTQVLIFNCFSKLPALYSNNNSLVHICEGVWCFTIHSLILIPTFPLFNSPSSIIDFQNYFYLPCLLLTPRLFSKLRSDKKAISYGLNRLPGKFPTKVFFK